MIDQSLLDVDKIEPQHLKTLYRITRAMNSSLDFDEVANMVMDAMMQVTRAERGCLLIVDEGDEGQLTVLVSRTPHGDPQDPSEVYSTTIVNKVVETRQPLLTNDAQYDGRYEPGKSIILRNLRAVLCAPMLVKGRLVGVVYVDTSMKTGNFSDSDRDLLSAVAGQAATAIENARLYQVAVEKGRIERELQMAREMQQALLPQSMPRVPGYEIAARWQSAREVAGDFYDLFVLEDGSLGLVIADVSDKGAGAALFMAVSRSMIRTFAYSGLSPLDTLWQTNELILQDAVSGTFVTVYHSVFGKQGTSVHVNAGHNPPLLYRSSTNEVVLMPRGGRAIGWFPDNPLRLIDVLLEPGDVIVYYTDGLTEAENPHGDFFGEERLAQLVFTLAHKPVEQIAESIFESVNTFLDGMPPFDDLTLCVVRYTG